MPNEHRTRVTPLPLVAYRAAAPRKPWWVYESVVSFVGDRPTLLATNGNGEVFAFAVVYPGADKQELIDGLHLMIRSLRPRP